MLKIMTLENHIVNSHFVHVQRNTNVAQPPLTSNIWMKYDRNKYHAIIMHVSDVMVFLSVVNYRPVLHILLDCISGTEVTKNFCPTSETSKKHMGRKSHNRQNDMLTTELLSTTNLCAYFMGHTFEAITFCAPWASCQIRKIAGCACTGNAGIVFPGYHGLAIPPCITAHA